MPIERPSEAAIERAAQLLQQGALVAFPTETVYGLGADATSGEAVARLYEAKGRPRFNPLIAHVADIVEVTALAELSPLARRLADAFWPGPLTLVLARRADCRVSELATAGLDTIAIRIPAHPLARRLLQAVGRPVVAPSANRSGHVSATSAAHVDADLGPRVGLILDGGPSAIGLESTIVDASASRPRLLRAGAIPSQTLAGIAGALEQATEARERPDAPGQLASHYAPRTPLRLHATTVAADEALLAFGPALPGHRGPTINLSPRGNLIEAAARLFSALRELDALRPSTIAVMAIPNVGLGEAINDRLARGAAPRTDNLS